jgi:hypothetical protein
VADSVAPATVAIPASEVPAALFKNSRRLFVISHLLSFTRRA